MLATTPAAASARPFRWFIPPDRILLLLIRHHHRRRSFVASLILSTSPFITCMERTPVLIDTLMDSYSAPACSSMVLCCCHAII